MTPRPQSASATPLDSASRAHRGSLLLRAAAAAAGLALLTGCTVEVVDRRDDTASPTLDEINRDDDVSATTTTPGSTESTESTDDGSEPESTDQDAEEPTAPADPTETTTDPAADDSPTAVATPSAPKTTVSCGDDGTLVLWQAGQAVELTEDCDHVSVAAADVQLTARSITTLDVAAAGVVVHATEIGTLSVAGSGNTVVWDEGSPSISDFGADNVLVSS